MLERLCGNAALKENLSAALASGTLAQSVLLLGEEGCGVGFAAQCVAADYLFPQGGPQAEAVLRDESTECLTLQGEGAAGSIKVEAVRSVREKLFSTALSSQGRVVLIYGAQNLSAATGNMLLKVLEEPPPDVLFLLAARSAAAILPTIRSRCALYTLSPVSERECAAAICRASPLTTPAQAGELAQLYGGKIGSGLAVVTVPERRASLTAARALCDAAAQNDTYTLLRLLSAYEKDKPALRQVLSDLTALAASSLRGQALSPLSPAQAARSIEAADAALRRCDQNRSQKLLLTLLAAELSA